MIKFILKAFGPIKGQCKHKYTRVQTVHGDMINALNGKRSLWKCKQCGKFVWSKSLTEVQG